MAWGILEDYKLPNVPGTTLLDAGHDPDPSEIPATANLKKHGDVVLSPQPTDSPNDPLNWPEWKKWLIVIIISAATGVTIALATVIMPAYRNLTIQYHVSFNKVTTYMSGLPHLCEGLAVFFIAAAATIWGKRPVFLISTAILLATSIWGYYAKSWNSLIAMRIIQGFAGAPLETLVSAQISDIFFVHQRGKRMGIFHITVLCSASIGQAISGYIIDDLGLKYTFLFCGLAYAIVLPAMYFGVPETAYNTVRVDTIESAKSANTIEEIVKEDAQTAESKAIESGKADSKHVEVVELEALDPERPPDTTHEKKKPRVEELRIFNGRVSNKSFWKVCWAPLTMYAYPAIVYSTLVYGSFQTWFVAMSRVGVEIYTGPYGLKPHQVGLTHLPNTVVGIIATLFSAWFIDWIIRFMSRKNRGIYEPEFRLTLMSIAVIISTIGFVGFGYAVGPKMPGITRHHGKPGGKGLKPPKPKTPIYVPIAFATLHGLAMPFSSAAGFTYVIDCYGPVANEAFAAINFAKAVLSFAASTHMNGWYESVGAKSMFSTIAIANVLICSLTIPMYIYGKRLRSWVARNKFLNRKMLSHHHHPFHHEHPKTEAEAEREVPPNAIVAKTEHDANNLEETPSTTTEHLKSDLDIYAAELKKT